MKTFILEKSYYRVAILFAVLSFIFFSGCEDNFLDRQPLDRLSKSTFWNTENDAMMALTGVYFEEGNAYDYLDYSLWNQDTHMRLFEATTDNGKEKDNFVTLFNNGGLNQANTIVAGLWTSSYLKICKCNNFLDNIDNVKMDLGKLAQIKAEVKTIRAFNYFYLAFLWGDVPLITKVQTINEANSVTRTPRAEVIMFVIDELNSAIGDLPKTRPAGETGRITKGGALAILGRVQMEEKKWTDAVSTYKQIIDMNIYAIDPRFKELFEDGGENSLEIILSIKKVADLYGTQMQRDCLGFTYGGWYQFAPFNELVEEFECIDGKPISESPLYDVDKPYLNRDPRLYSTFFIDKLTVFKGKLFVTHPDSSPVVYKDQLTRRNWTGYGLKKFTDEGFTGNIASYGGDFTIVRYAEVLLSYLESNIESGVGITQGLLDQTINKVRGRAAVSMPAITETDPAKLTTILRRERRVELAWEGLRLYDLFRWHIAHINLKSRFYGMKLCPVALAPTYTKFPINANGYYFCEESNFRENVDYLWPIPQDERDINPNITQNPGY
jgi:hypothetical protein